MPEVKRKKGGGTYIKYSDEEIQQAKNISMIDFLGREYGYTFLRVGNYYKGREHDSLMIKSDERTWYWNSQNLSGRNVFDWLTSVENYTFTECLEKIIGTTAVAQQKKYDKAPNLSQLPIDEVKELQLPKKYEGRPSQLFAYLCKTRCLDADIVGQLVHEKLIYQDDCNNVVFVGKDESGEIRFCERKMTNTYLANLKDENGKKVFPPINVKGSDKRYSFNTPCDKEKYPLGANTLYVFESPVDLLSHATFRYLNEKARAEQAGEKPDINAWKNVNRLSLSSVASTALDSYLERNPNIEKIVFALDYDSTGIKMATKYEKEYAEKGYQTSKIRSNTGKDWNEALQMYTAYLNSAKEKNDMPDLTQQSGRGRR